MAKNAVSRALLLLGLSVLLGSAIACGGGDNKTTAPPPPAKELNSAVLGHLATYPHTFTTAGSFAYHCAIHPTMHGTVVVDPASAVTSGSVSIINHTFSPASITVAPNATVTWTNQDGTDQNPINHTVTSD
jgi:plastocyanin